MEQGTTILNTPKDDNSQAFNLKFDNCEYRILLNIEKNQLLILCQNNTQLSNFCYKNHFSLWFLNNLNKLFLCLSSLEEILNSLKELFKNNKVKIKKENEKINLLVTLTNLIGKEEQISLILNQSSLSNNEIISNYFLQINKLKEIIEEEKRKNEILTKRIEKLEEWKNLKNIIDSRIIENESEINFIINRLKNNDEKKKKKYILKKFIVL